MITIPTLKALNEAVINDLEAAYGSRLSLFGKVFLRALAGVQAAKLKLFYLAIGFLQKNSWVDTADPERKGGTLERYGRIKLGRNPFPAVAGAYVVTVTGEIGATIKPQTTFKSNDGAGSPGKLFVLDEQHTMAGNPDTIVIRALESGLASRLDTGDTLTVTAPLAGVDSTATVTAEDTEPQDAEDLELYRERAIEAYRLEPQGGAAADYRLWASDAQGVQQSYPYARSSAPGEVNLFIEAVADSSVDGKGTPSGLLLSAVRSVVEQDPDTAKPAYERGRQPLTAIVNYLPVTVRGITIAIAGFAEITPARKTLIKNALSQTIAAIRPFIAGADVLAHKNDVLNKNTVIAVILQAVPGALFTDITTRVDGTIITTYTFSEGNIPYLEAVTYP